MISNRTALTLLAVLACASLAIADPSENDIRLLLREGKYLEETLRDLDAAIDKFEQVRGLTNADSRSLAISDLAVARCMTKKGNHSEARQRLHLVMHQYPNFPSLIREVQDLLQRMPESNPATFMPQDTLVYAELTQPWSQMERLARLLDEAGVMKMLQAQRFDPSLALFHTVLSSINMKRLPEIRKIEGLGVALLGLTVDPTDETSPPKSRFLLVLYPGQSDWYRSVAAFIKGTQAPLEQHFDFEIYKLPTSRGELVLGLGKEAMLFGSDLESLVNGIYTARDDAKPSLADDPGFQRQAAARRQDSAIIAYSNLSRLLPILQRSNNNKSLDIVDTLLDLDSVTNLMARVDLDDERMVVELTALLEEGRANKFYEVWKSGPLDPEVFLHIPQEAVGAVSMTLQETGRRWEESFALFEALYGAKWQESAGVDFMGIADATRTLLESERGKQILGNLYSFTCIFTDSDKADAGVGGLFDDLVILVHVKDEWLVENALEELSNDYLRRSNKPHRRESSLNVLNERTYRLADTGPIRLVVQRGNWVFASASSEGIEKCLKAKDSGTCLGDLPSNDPLRRVPLKVNKFGYIQFDRLLETWIKKHGNFRKASRDQVVPVIFTTLEKPQEIIIRIEVDKLPVLIGQIAEAIFSVSRPSENGSLEQVRAK